MPWKRHRREALRRGGQRAGACRSCELELSTAVSESGLCPIARLQANLGLWNYCAALIRHSPAYVASPRGARRENEDKQQSSATCTGRRQCLCCPHPSPPSPALPCAAQCHAGSSASGLPECWVPHRRCRFASPTLSTAGQLCRSPPRIVDLTASRQSHRNHLLTFQQHGFVLADFKPYPGGQ